MKRRSGPAVLLAVLLLGPAAARAQLLLGQYEDEAPLATWNTLGAASAPSLALGGTQLARAWDVSSGLANPALLAGLPRFSASLAASYGAASLYRYALVNTGVVTSSSNLSVGVVGLDHGGAAFRSGAWAFALAVSAPESYARPSIVYSDGGYQLTFDQTGALRVFHAVLARRLPGGLAVGAGVNYATGTAGRTTVERSADILRVVTITDDKRESFRGLSFGFGLTWTANTALTAGLSVRSSYIKKGPAESLVRYEVPVEGTDIRIDAAATNSYRQPWIVAAGLSYRLGRAWSFAADAAWFGWSRYEAVFFDEPLARVFRNVVKAGAGVQYLASAGAVGRRPRVPLRLGLTVDPQPATSVRSNYVLLTFGAGLEFRRIAVDLAGSVGRERGTERGQRAAKIALSARYIFRE
jgi:long-subunit fatty acid transport protein